MPKKIKNLLNSSNDIHFLNRLEILFLKIPPETDAGKYSKLYFGIFHNYSQMFGLYIEYECIYMRNLIKKSLLYTK